MENARREDLLEQAQVDSEEEKEAIMAAVSSYVVTDPFSGAISMGAPLAPWVPPIPVRRRYEFQRIKNAFRAAMKNGPIFNTLDSPTTAAAKAAAMSADPARVETRTPTSADRPLVIGQQPSRSMGT